MKQHLSAKRGIRSRQVIFDRVEEQKGDAWLFEFSIGFNHPRHDIGPDILAWQFNRLHPRPVAAANVEKPGASDF